MPLLIPVGDGPFAGRVFGSSKTRRCSFLFKNPAFRQDFIKRVIGLLRSEPEVRRRLPERKSRSEISITRCVGLADCDPTTSEDVCPPTHPGMTRNTARLFTTEKLLRMDSRRDCPAATQRRFQRACGHYFMMGDNRDKFNDSRLECYVPAITFCRKAMFRFFPPMQHSRSLAYGRFRPEFTGID